eukprot:scaffold135922_cov41-Prasinocladus_malaysianus.AAC.1
MTCNRRRKTSKKPDEKATNWTCVKDRDDPRVPALLAGEDPTEEHTAGRPRSVGLATSLALSDGAVPSSWSSVSGSAVVGAAFENGLSVLHGRHGPRLRRDAVIPLFTSAAIAWCGPSWRLLSLTPGPLVGQLKVPDRAKAGEPGLQFKHKET